MLRIDHVLLAVRDLDAAASAVETAYGLGSVPGGRHAGHGTANRIVPLGGGAYLELIGVVDAAEAEGSVLGRQVATAAGSFFGWCVATDDLDAIAARLGREPLAMGRPNHRGEQLSWRLAGLEDSVADPALPFFITWDDDLASHPSREATGGRTQPLGVALLTVAADPDALSARLGPGHGLPLEVVDEEPRGVRSVRVTTAEGELTVVPL
jgi:hypothetical protein